MHTHDFTWPLFGGATFVPPRIVARIWDGKDRHYATGSAELYDRVRCRGQLERDGAGGCSDSTIDRAITNYGEHGRKQAGLVPKFPILREQQRPWLVPQFSDGGVPTDMLRDLETLHRLGAELEAHVENENLFLAHTRLVLLRLERRLRGFASVAALFFGAFRVLDVVSDGKANWVIEWCHLLGRGHLRL